MYFSGRWIYNARYNICFPPAPDDSMDDCKVDLCKFMKQNTDETLTSELLYESDEEL